MPVGSLYRHVALLTNAGVLSVVAERRVRGAVERTYGLRPSAAQMQPDEARPRLANAPGRGRRRRTFYQVLMAAPEAAGSGRKTTTASRRSGRSRA